MLTDFGKLLHQLRLENGEKDLKHQASLLGISSAALSHVSRGTRPVAENWPRIIASAYHMTDEEFERRLASISGAESTIESSNGQTVSPTGLLLTKLCDEQKLTLQDISDKTHFPMQYINYICTTNKRPQANFFEKLFDSVPMSSELKDAFARGSDGVLSSDVFVGGRTIFQRSVLWHLTNNIHLLTEDAIAKLQEIVSLSVSDGKQYSDDVTPIGYYISDVMETSGMSMRRMSSVANIPSHVLPAIRKGTRVFDESELSALSGVIWDGASALCGLSFLNRISMDSMSIPTERKISSVEQVSFLQSFLEALPYISDARAEEIFHFVWTARYYGPVRKVGKKVQRTSWGTRPYTPSGEFIRHLMSRNSDSTNAFVEKTGVSGVAFGRFSRGETDMTYEQFCGIADGYRLGPGEKELFRFLCSISRRAIVLDMAPCSIKHRIVAEDLQNKYSLLTAEDLESIDSILKKYR